MFTGQDPASPITPAGPGAPGAAALRSPADPSGSGAFGSAVAPSPAPPGSRPRARFGAGELAMVCSRYDVGVIEGVREYPRGSSRAPKVLLRTSAGAYLLKRRHIAPGRSPEEVESRVLLSHALQAHLASRGFPLPRLLETRTEHATLLTLDGNLYELFEYLPGEPYDDSLDATADAGRLLARFHALAADFPTGAGILPGSSYHGGATPPAHLTRIATRPDLEPRRAELEPLLRRLRLAYTDAAHRADALGVRSWPEQVIHADWHPGNMVFAGHRVRAVLDYDAIRLAPRAVDIANAALQFSMTLRADDPESWPAELDEGRFKRLTRAYDAEPGAVISTAELRALPWLMIEALIAEAASPIAATGAFGGLDGPAFLRMVDAKAAWIAGNAERLAALVAG